jgi:hypothetical protein
MKISNKDFNTQSFWDGFNTLCSQPLPLRDSVALKNVRAALAPKVEAFNQSLTERRAQVEQGALTQADFEKEIMELVGEEVEIPLVAKIKLKDTVEISEIHLRVLECIVEIPAE